MNKAGNAEPGNVIIFLPGTDLETYSNEDGTCVIKAPVLLSLKMEYSLEGYKTVMMEVAIKRGPPLVSSVK